LTFTFTSSCRGLYFYIYMAWYLVNYGDNLTFTFTSSCHGLYLYIFMPWYLVKHGDLTFYLVTPITAWPDSKPQVTHVRYSHLVCTKIR